MSTAINEEVLELAGTETPNMWFEKTTKMVAERRSI